MENNNHAPEKKKVSPFEFAIMSVADPEAAKSHEPYTSDEVLQQRKDNLRRQFEKITFKKPVSE